MNLAEFTTSTLKEYAESREIPQRASSDLSTLEHFLLKRLHLNYKDEERLNKGDWKLSVDKSHTYGENDYYNFKLKDSTQLFERKFEKSECRHIIQIIDNPLT